MFTSTTHNIKVTVFPAYLEDQSLPDEDHYVWAYTVHLENHGQDTVQLIGRYWHITDSHGMIQEVRGSGVVGEQPSLSPGETYHYTSGAALHTPSGLMTGHYEMKHEDGSAFTIEIPTFSLDSPEQKQRPN